MTEETTPPTEAEAPTQEQAAEQAVNLLIAARQEVMRAFGAEYGPRVAPFVTSVRKAKSLFGCDAFGVFGVLNETGWAAMLHSTAKALMLAALHDEVRFEARKERRMVIVP